MKGIARFLVTPEILCDALHLPAGTAIVWADMDLRRREIELTIEHPDLREVELVNGARPPLICPRFQREDGVVMVVDWGQE